MIALAVFAAIVVSAGLAIWKLAPFVNRIVTLAETRVEAQKPKEIESVPMPPQLYSFAMNESEEWAQEQVLKTMREMYGECGDWNMVYSTMLIREAKDLQAQGQFS